MVHRSFPEVFGRFDENFVPAYCEDCDCHARIALSGKKAYVYGGARFFHFGSQTMAADEQVRADLASRGGANGRYFIEKWGHGIINEVDGHCDLSITRSHTTNQTERLITGATHDNDIQGLRQTIPEPTLYAGRR